MEVSPSIIAQLAAPAEPWAEARVVGGDLGISIGFLEDAEAQAKIMLKVLDRMSREHPEATSIRDAADDLFLSLAHIDQAQREIRRIADLLNPAEPAAA